MDCKYIVDIVNIVYYIYIHNKDITLEAYLPPLSNFFYFFLNAMQTQTWLSRLLLKPHLFFSGSVLCINGNPRFIPRNYLSMERALQKERGKNHLKTSE